MKKIIQEKYKKKSSAPFILSLKRKNKKFVSFFLSSYHWVINNKNSKYSNRFEAIDKVFLDQRQLHEIIGMFYCCFVWIATEHWFNHNVNFCFFLLFLIFIFITYFSLSSSLTKKSLMYYIYVLSWRVFEAGNNNFNVIFFVLDLNIKMAKVTGSEFGCS